MTTSAEHMVHIRGGEFAMGSDRHYQDEGPVRTIAVEGFWISKYAVTNREFADFVAATGHVTVAEQSTRSQAVPGGTTGEPRTRFDGVHNDGRPCGPS